MTGRYRFQVLKQLGQGGFGSVYLARCLDAGAQQKAPPEHVAVKVLGEAKDPRALTSLKRELAALLAIEHDRIPRLYDWNLEGGHAFVALHYYPAGSLADRWAFLGRMDEDQVWRLLSDLLAALHAAHRASILHLDVKPSNVLVDDHGGFVLTDFGVSQSARMSKGLLHQGQLSIGLGTHGYRAPEQDERSIQQFDLRTDLWGVGATAWALYTGIDLNRRQDVLRHRDSGNIFGLRRLSDVAISTPPTLEEIIMDLLYIDPTSRPGGAAEVLARVRAIVDGLGKDSRTVASARRPAGPHEMRQVINHLMDPLWASICRSPGFERFFVRYERDDVICHAGQDVHHTLMLLRGRVRIEREGELLDVEEREGSLLGIVSTLAGAPREVTLRADGPVWGCLFNEAELEQLITCNSAVAVRILRTLANRIAQGPPRVRVRDEL
ncbi:MAG: serine/threonine-protein kinase [Proteobacteria bacterium]|nr:serine/threonine-protein kinase [Pseudomonadota bacterium]